MSAFDQHLLHCILYLLNRWNLLSNRCFQRFFNLLGKAARHLIILAARGLRRAEDRVCDLFDLKGRPAPVTLDNLLDHIPKVPFSYKNRLAAITKFRSIFCKHAPYLVPVLYILPRTAHTVKGLRGFW